MTYFWALICLHCTTLQHMGKGPYILLQILMKNLRIHISINELQSCSWFGGILLPEAWSPFTIRYSFDANPKVFCCARWLVCSVITYLFLMSFIPLHKKYWQGTFKGPDKACSATTFFKNLILRSKYYKGCFKVSSLLPLILKRTKLEKTSKGSYDGFPFKG